MGAEFSTLTVEKDENPNIKNRFFVKIDKETSVVVYTNPPNETYSKPSSSFRFTKGDDLMFCLIALKHAGFHPYKSNGIGAGFSFIGEEGDKTQTFYNMHKMKKTVNGETCYWNPDTKTLNIPNKCLTFEEIKKIFDDITKIEQVQPPFNPDESNFPVLLNSRTPSPVVEETSTSAPVVVEETSTSAPVGVKKDALFENTIKFPSATVKVDDIHAKLIRDGNGGLGTINIRDTGYAIYCAMYPVKNGNILCACVSINGIQCQVVY